MPRPYPQPNLSTSNDLFKYANTVTDNFFGPLAMTATLIVLFMLFRMRGYKTSDSMAVASMLTLVLGSLLWAMGTLSGKAIVLFLILTIASTLWSIFER